jgi:separase
MLEAIQLKLPDPSAADDLRWPLMTSSGEPLAAPPSTRHKKRMKAQPRNDSDEEDEDVDLEDANMKTYWTGVRQRHAAFSLDEQTLISDQAKHLPEHWVVVHISVSEDKNTMFISRQRANHQPLVFCLPLKGRREGDDDEEQLGFEDVVAELEEIIRLSDESTRNGQSVPNHRDARAAWWAERAALDKRMMELVGNIEFCWLGAFKVG